MTDPEPFYSEPLDIGVPHQDMENETHSATNGIRVEEMASNVPSISNLGDN